jgi:hypothetical protein
MRDKFSQRIEAALARLAARIARSKKRLDPATPNRRSAGRILQQNSVPPPASRSRWSRMAAPLVCALARLQRRIRRLGRALGGRLWVRSLA